MERDADRSSARRRSLPCPFQYLPGPAGHVVEAGSDTGIYPGHEQENESWIRKGRDRLSCVACKRGDLAAARRMRAQRRGLPSGDPGGSRLPGGCDNAGTPTIPSSGSPDPRPKPSRSRQRLAEFLRDDLKLELNPDKTLITHARTQAAHYLGYEITVQHSGAEHRRPPAVNGRVGLRVPQGSDQG